MTDSKVFYLHNNKPNSGTRGAKRKLEPVPEFRKCRDLVLPATKGEPPTTHYYKKLKGVFYKYGLGKQIVLDENGEIIAGMKHFKDLEFEAYLVPVFVFYNLTKEEKIACRLVAKDWELLLAQKKLWAEERRHD